MRAWHFEPTLDAPAVDNYRATFYRGYILSNSVESITLRPLER
jgi:hypothetical protein